MAIAKTTAFKLPPQDLDAENSVLGSLMLDKDAIVRVADVLSPEDFYHPGHQRVYEAIVELFSRGEPIDIVTVANKLKAKKMFKEIGGADYLAELVSRVPTSAHVEEYANIVREKRIRREIINASSVINENAFEHADFEQMIDEVEQKIFGISQRSRPQKFTHIKEGLTEAYERMERLHQGDQGALRGIPTSFTRLDNLLSGFQRSDMIILGARPSVGKTSFALDIARNAAVAGYSVGVFSVEMSKDQIIDRLISSQAQIPLWRMRSGKLNGELEFGLVQQALDELARANIYIDDSSSPTILQMRSTARRLQIEHKLDLLVVDYIQLIKPLTSSDNVVQQVSEISRGLKALARELNIPVLALSQLSRDIEKRDSKTPRLSDLRDSGSLEQDADVILFLAREKNEQPDLPTTENGLAKLYVAKHRNGPTGEIELGFHGETASFRNLDTHHSYDGD